MRGRAQRVAARSPHRVPPAATAQATREGAARGGEKGQQRAARRKRPRPPHEATADGGGARGGGPDEGGTRYMIKIPSLCSQYAVNMQVQNGSSTTAGMGVRARLHTPGDRRAGSHPASSRDTLLTSEPGLGLAILRLGARLDRLSSSGTCEESTRGDPCCGPSAFTCSPRRVFGASRTPSTQLSWGHGAAHKLPSQPR